MIRKTNYYYYYTIDNYSNNNSRKLLYAKSQHTLSFKSSLDHCFSNYVSHIDVEGAVLFDGAGGRASAPAVEAWGGRHVHQVGASANSKARG